MSMIANYIRIAPEQLAELQADPDSIGNFLESLFESLYPEKQENEDEMQPTPPTRHLDIDKAWHGIHFLLNGNAWEGEPPCWLIANCCRS